MYDSNFVIFRTSPTTGGLNFFIGLIGCCILALLSPESAKAQKALKAEYYDGDNFEQLVATKYVDNIEYSWYDEPPVPGIDPHKCSIRWTGKLRTSRTDNYLFSAIVDDGIRVWIDDQLIINQWNLNDVGVFSGKMHLVANQEYDLKVEYFNALLEGEIQLLWAIEKTKDDMSWYERLFGVEYDFEVISPEYFVPPPPAREEESSQKEKPVGIKKDKAKTVKKKVEVNPPTQQKTVEAPAVKPIAEQKPKPVESLEEAEKYIPKNVQFKLAEAEILPSSYQDLNTFAKFLIDNPHVDVMIEGHTEPVGNPAKNRKLSELRAIKVAGYLVDKGVDGERLKFAGYGGSRPLKEQKKGEHFVENRRVVFVLSGLE